MIEGLTSVPGRNASTEPGVLPSSPAARIVAGLKALAGLLAALLLTPAISGFVSREPNEPDDLLLAKATRNRG